MPIRAFLFNLKENFVSYHLHSALKLSSQWKNKANMCTYPLDELKQMLHLKDPKGKEPELFQNISQLKARVLNIAVRQASGHTDLRIDYELLKKGRAYDAVRFTIARQQPQQLPIPFVQTAEDARVYSAKQHLEALGITQPQLVATILGDPKHLDQLFKFTYRLKTDKVKATKNPGAFLEDLRAAVSRPDRNCRRVQVRLT